jgi:hypothetical protein
VLAVGVGAQGAFAAYNLGLPALGPALQAQFRVGLTQTGVLLAVLAAACSPGCAPLAPAERSGWRRPAAAGPPQPAAPPQS